MNRVLIITPLSEKGVPMQGALIAQRLKAEGVLVTLVGRGDSGSARLADVALRGLFKALHSDVVLVNVYGKRAFVYESLAILYGRLWGKRVVAMLRGGWLADFVDDYPRWTRAVLARAHVTIAPHQFLTQALTQRGIRVDTIIPNFVELSVYRYRERARLAPRILYQRGFHSFYDPQTVVRAFARVQACYPDASLTLAGRPGPELKPCQALASSLKLRNVTWPGLVSKEEIPRLADGHDLYVQANLVENMPVSVIEMWASGVPVVATDVGGTPYLIRHGQDGLLVRPQDPAALADTCLKLLSEPELAVRLSRTGRERAAELCWDRVGPAWLAVLGFTPTPDFTHPLSTSEKAQ